MFRGIDTSGSGMAMAKKWMEVTSNNISNINTTRGANGEPYHRQTVILEEVNKFDSYLNKNVSEGVRIKEIAQDKAVDLVYNPDNPDAGPDGYVKMPAVNLTAEMTNLMVAQKAYDANSSAFSANKKMMEKELDLGKF